MEPCPLCFSALYLSGVRTLHYAARDNYGGSTNLYGATEYFTRKTIAIHGPDRKMEEIQLVLAVDYVRRRFKGPIIDTLVDAWRKDCPQGIALGEQWFADNRLQQLSQQQSIARRVVNAIAEELKQGKME
jgi:tRNA(adenine34) deaminase